MSGKPQESSESCGMMKISWVSPQGADSNKGGGAIPPLEKLRLPY